MDIQLLMQPQEWPIYGHVALISAAILFIMMIYLYWHTRWLQHHIHEVMPERQLDYLFRKWRWRNYRLIMGMMFIAMTATITAQQWPTLKPLFQAPAPDCPTPTATQPASPIEPSSSVLELFDTPVSGQHSAALEEIKQQYENALATAFILKRCERALETDIEALEYNLQQALSELNTPEKPLDIPSLYASIKRAATGSYDLFYHRTPCDSPELDIAEQQLASISLKYQAVKSKQTSTPD